MTLSRFRFWFQLASTILTNSYVGVFFTRTISTHILKGVCVPYLNCYACPSALFSCPIGTLQHFVAIHTVPYYWLGLVGLVGLTTGRMACGWLCPFGFLQELMFKIKCRKFVVPIYLTYLKYVVLVVLVVMIPYFTGELAFSQLCPAGTLTAGIPWVLWNPTNPATGQSVLPDGPGVLFAVDVVILAVCLVWFVVSKRPFCRVICPMGAILSVFNHFSFIRLEVDRKCDGCSVCQVNCPTDLTVAMDVDSGDCIRCLECTRCGHVKIAPVLTHQHKGQRACVKM